MLDHMLLFDFATPAGADFLSLFDGPFTDPANAALCGEILI
jgi:hypothetical protein